MIVPGSRRMFALACSGRCRVHASMQPVLARSQSVRPFSRLDSNRPRSPPSPSARPRRDLFQALPLSVRLPVRTGPAQRNTHKTGRRGVPNESCGESRRLLGNSIRCPRCRGPMRKPVPRLGAARENAEEYPTRPGKARRTRAAGILENGREFREIRRTPVHARTLRFQPIRCRGSDQTAHAPAPLAGFVPSTQPARSQISLIATSSALPEGVSRG